MSDYLVLVCGSRSWTDRLAILRELAKLPADTVLLHGGCPSGADAIADYYWRKARLPLKVMKADWAQYGRFAGPLRNQAMVNLHPKKVLAFWDGVSSGTAHTISIARAANIEVIVVKPCPSTA